jgi:dynein heavy chain
MLTPAVIHPQAVMDPMYQYSLSYFAKLFNHCVDTAQSSDDLPTRLRTLLV